MADKPALFAITVLMACALTACGQKGPLYLPEAPTEVVTRPAATPPPSPAPEVTAPEETPPADQPEDPKKDKKSAPPPK